MIRRTFCSTVTAGAAGTFTVPNPATTSPSGIFYRVTVKDSSTGQEVLRYAGVTFSGTTFGFDSYVPVLAGAVFSPLTGTSVTGSLAVSGNLNVTGRSRRRPSRPIVRHRRERRWADKRNRYGSKQRKLIWFDLEWILVERNKPVPENWACVGGPASTIPNPRRSFFSCTHSPGIPLARVQFMDNNPATAGSQFCSPDIDFVGHYWNGTASAADELLLSTSLWNRRQSSRNSHS